MNKPYYSIPDFPDKIEATNVIARLVDGLGFRYRWATEGLTDKEYNFKPCDSSMNLKELMEHIYNSSIIANRAFGGAVESNKRLENTAELRNETLIIYEALSTRLKEMDDIELYKLGSGNREMGQPFWFMINGPIADALTHVGQITSWRRIAGNPQPRGVNVFSGKKHS